jgi:trimeric autotransporter adhesin
MSTKTTFKRIALVAVAALGLGVISVAPSSAGVSQLTLTVTNGTAAAGKSDSSTAATITVAGLVDVGAGDSITVTFIAKNNSANTAAVARMSFMETTTGNSVTNPVQVSTGRGAYVPATKWGNTNGVESITAGAAPMVVFTGAAAYIGAKFGVQLESTTASTGTAGVFTYTALVSSYAGATLIASTAADFTITIAELASVSKTASAAHSTAVLAAGSATPAYNAVDEAVSAVATASGSAAATVSVHLFNASGPSNYAQESITATITGPGTIGLRGGTFGKSVVIQAAQAVNQLDVRADGTAGVATINVSTPSVTFAPKTVTFYAKSPKTITAANYAPVLNVGTNSGTAAAVVATAVDANGTNWSGALYIKAVAAADALVGGSATDPVLCSYITADKVHLCPVTTKTTGTAKFVVVDESLDTDAVYAAADSAATSNEVTVTVSSGAPTTVKLAFDKATYQPFEKATVTVTPLDAAGKTIGTRAITNLFATGGITSNIAFGSQSDTLTSVTLTTAAATTSSTNAGSYTYTVYMPAQGDVVISATGGTGLAAAGQVKVTATATVVNSSVDAATDAANEATDAANAATDAALAAADAADAATAAAQDASDAVAALSASVSKLISSLRAQITSLTNLVIKIQKKVRA